MLERLAYSPKEAAQALGLSPKTVRNLIRAGKLPAVMIGSRRLLVPREGIIRWLEGNR